MSETTNLKLFKHDNPSTNENQFDIETALNDNWDTIDDFAGDVNDKVIEIEDNLDGQAEDIEITKQELEQEIQELEQDIQSNAIIEETEQAKQLYIPDASGARGRLDVLGNVEQETSTQGKNYFTGNKIGSGTEKGLTYSFNNSILKVNGTTAASGNIILDAPIGVKLPAGTYTFTAKKITGDYTKPAGKDFALYFRDKDDFITGDYASSGITGTTLQNNSGIYSRQITITEETEIYFRFFVSSADIVINNLELEIQIEQGSSYTEFEQFIPNSPSINYPSPLKILGDNINLFNKNEVIKVGRYNSSGEFVATATWRYFEFTPTPNTDYTIQVKNKFSNEVYFVGFDEGGTETLITSFSAKVVTFNSRDFTKIGYSVEENELDNCKLEKGPTATSYSPYGQGSTEISVYNKNILNVNDFTQTAAGVTITKSGDIFTMNGTATSNNAFIFNPSQVIKLLGNYTLSIKYISGTKSGTSNFNVRNNDTNSVVFNTNLTTLDTSTNANIESATKIKYGIYVTANATFSNFMFKVQLEKGATATDPVEHQEQNYILDIQQPMLKWDYFDLERKKEVHVTNKIVLDGTKKFVVGNPAGRYYLDTELNNLNYEAISNCFKQGAENTFNVDNTIVLQTNRINLMNKEIATAEEFNNAVLELYNAGTPIEIYYPTTEPTELDLTESQIQVLEQLNKLRLYKEVNNIFTLEDIALLQAEYGVDIQTKINNVISTQLSQIGGN